jgi:Zinc carboxypeptidase
MKPLAFFRISVFILLALSTFSVLNAKPAKEADSTERPGRDMSQPLDEEYTRKIREYTTKPFFNSPLTDYLPASPNVPTPKAVLGDIAGAPGILPYTSEVHSYMRMLEKASPRVRVFSIGTSEEGREMIAVAISSQANLAQLDANRARLAKLADPRTINMSEAEADKLVADSVPVYYVTGTIHSTETGSPTALMELAYRLAVDESPYVNTIRNGVITLITPVVETDGRDRMVDLYRWHVAHPNEQYPPLLYWGHYVAHDNNRDAMALTLKLTRNVLNTYLGWKPQVLHDLHESVPYLYDNTVGDEPYNAWIDPILTNEWQIIGWNNVAEMTKFGMPGVFAHGTFDTWSPGYLMFIAATHNGISRLYETFGNGGADTVERTLSPQDVARTWYRQNPPLPKALWSQRNNNNYQQTGLLVSLHHFADNRQMFLKNFFLKSKRSIEKARTEGPAAYIFPADDPRPGGQAELLRLLQAQGCEISRASAAFTVTMPAKKADKDAKPDAKNGARKVTADQKKPAESSTPETLQFPAGSYLVRMDQPYSRIADMLLDHQYWSPSDPQSAYDDTAWTFGELGNVRVTRATDTKVLDVPMEKVTSEIKAPGGIQGSGAVFLVNHNADNTLMTLCYRLKNVSMAASEEPFEVSGRKFNRGSFIISGASRETVEKEASALGLQMLAVPTAPTVKTHAVKAARIALMHTWLNTQDEGWWRIAFDQLGIPYSYITTQDVSNEKDLATKYDVIIFAPVGGGSTQTIISGLPTYRNALPWKKTPQTPNLGTFTSTDDIRPGLGWSGVQNLQEFVRHGGLLISTMDTSEFALATGFAPGVSTTRSQKLKAPGTVVRSQFVDLSSPIAYGYEEKLSVFYGDGPIFNISSTVGGRGGRRRASEGQDRPTGRGKADDPDIPQGIQKAEEVEEPHAEVWEALPLTPDQMRNNPFVIPPAARPRVILRYSDAKELLVSGLLDGASELAQHAAVIDVPLDRGHVLLFSNNPFWRGETQGSYFLVFNAILNAGHLDAGRSNQ